MKAELFLHKPTNLVVPPGTRATVYVTGDVYDICRRLQELDESLHVVTLEGQEERYTHAIMELCRDGVERLIFKVGPADRECPELDGRVVEKCRRLLSQPLSARLVELEREEAKRQADHEAYQAEKLYEEMGRPMWTQLEKSGFIQRGVSYPKAGVATRGKRAR